MDPAFFHAASDTVRFWVALPGDQCMGASISRMVLHYSFSPQTSGEDPLATYHSHMPAIEAAVRRRVAQGALEPVMLREHDMRPTPG